MAKNKEESAKEKHSPKKLITLSSTQMWSPVKDIKDGVIITKDERFVQILEFAPINFALLPESEQESIAIAFGAAIKTFPKKFQIKVLSRKADVETHIQNIHKCMATETNDKCRAMQAQSIRQIQKDAVSGVSRRFFLSFAYEEVGGLRRPEWHDIWSSIAFQSKQIECLLSDQTCNNEMLSPIGSSDHTMDILYNCMCRKEAEMKSLDTKIADVVCSHISEHGLQAKENLNIPVNDFIAPQKIDTSHFNYVVVDGKYYMFGYIHRNAYPTRCYAGWMAPLVSLGEGVDIDIWVEQKTAKEIHSQLTYSMQVSQNNYMHKSRTAADIVSLENKIKSEEYIRQGLTNDQTLCFFSIMITVVADSAEQVRHKFKAVQNQIIAYGLDLRPLHGNHDLALMSSLPLCDPDKCVTRYAKRNVLSGDFGSFYPFTSYEINDPGGIMLGRNRSNNSPIFLDLYNRHLYNNGNMVIFGGSGSGKTFLLQCLALRLRQQQTQVIIIAPYKGHEYRKACNAIGGTYITIAPGSPHNINIMEIRKIDKSVNEALDSDFASNGSILTAKIQKLHTFFSLLKPNMTHHERQILDEALILTYKEKGITTGNKSLIDPRNPSRYKTMPTLGDLDNVLASKKGSQGIREALSRFVTGSCRSFNAQTNVNLNNPYVVIDVSNMPDALMPIAIFLANDYVFDCIQADRLKRKAVIIDEASRLIGPAGTPEAASFVLTETKLIRAFNGILVIATQDSNDFFALQDGYYGKGILANAKLKVVMKQEPEEVPVMTEKLMLSETESRRLTHFDRGEALLVANRNHAEIKVTASPMEERLITTDPEQLSKYIAQERKGG